MEYNPPTEPLDILHEDAHILVVNLSLIHI